MKHGTTMSNEEQRHFLLNAPHNPNHKIRPGWEDEEMTDEAFDRALDFVIANQKQKQATA